jgi:hypothetical protein
MVFCHTMKRTALPYLVLFAVLAWAACAPSERQMSPRSPDDEEDTEAAPTESEDMDPAALDDFRKPLEPYGRWVDDPTYGTVWVPSPDAVGPEFVPYTTAGHWALAEDDQWMWVSDYAWGWGPFHYGRWLFIDGSGWAWIPGRVYAPAWVVWRTGFYDEAYVGWGPMPPTWYWHRRVAVRVVTPLPARYVFVESRYAFEPRVRAHVVPAERVALVASHTQPFVGPAGGGRYNAVVVARGPAPAVARVPAAAVPRERVSYQQERAATPLRAKPAVRKRKRPR